ncbi:MULTISPECIES: DUF1963 domain-containing protein [Catenuloplanes]|uniref:DUF1963 domain-containing protein n=1 Tax=Catenuloplanes niger TaxID=587534 RepID=A0AAE4CNV3_9ACTN|nr:DUF1963 domain-containing protein [Catenuloplanes niger]MDR7319901.1 hypothetical protein [Catenuloplanes niger]
MDYRDEFRRAAVESGIPATEAAAFAEFIRFSIWTSPYYKGVPVGRSGGLPRLPAGTAWPESPEGPLPYVVEFDCAALPTIDGLALPADGSLLVFLHHEDAYETYSITGQQAYARIVHVPAGTETVPASEPEHGEWVFADSERPFVAPEYRLRATVRPELPHWLARDTSRGLSDFQQRLADTVPHRDRLRALLAELWPAVEYGSHYDLGGYTGHIGGLYSPHLYDTAELTMAIENLEARGVDDVRGNEEEELHRVMSEWVPLLQFHADDVHVARFLVRHDDLAAGRPDRAMLFCEFTE